MTNGSLDRAVGRRLRAFTVELIASDPEVGASIDRAKQHLAVILSEPNPPARAALAALALGDFDAAATLARSLGAGQLPDGTLPGETTADYLLLLTRHLAWTGDIHTLREEWPRILRAAAHPPPPTAGPHELRSWAAACRELPIAAESIGETSPPMQPVQVTQPGQVTGGAPECEPADLVDHYLHDLLGLEPDAPRNRLVLRPRLPEGWDHLELRCLRFGDAEIDLRYRRNGDHHRFSLVQESGAIPVRVIFEPALPGRRLIAARVDGVDATLDPRAVEGRVVVPIQIVLDDLREVELQGGIEEGRTRISLPVRHPTV